MGHLSLIWPTTPHAWPPIPSFPLFLWLFEFRMSLWHSSDGGQKKLNRLFPYLCFCSVSSADMEVALEMEDDLFFADLTKQISLLIMDDDEDPLSLTPPPHSLQAYSRRSHSPARPPLMHDQQGWQRESKGTGVFIPRSQQPRRKNRNGKFNSHNSKINRQSDSAQKVSPTYALPPKKC